MTATLAEAPPHAVRAQASTRSIAAKRTSPSKGPARSAGAAKSGAANIAMVAAVIGVLDNEPMVEVIAAADGRGADGLPTAPFHIADGRALEDALRAPLQAQTSHAIGYLQQLITFVGTERSLSASSGVVLVGYLALVHDRPDRMARRRRARSSRWHGCYQYLPWEDWRIGRPRLIEDVVLPRLNSWARQTQAGLTKTAQTRLQVERSGRVRFAFAAPGGPWDEDKVLLRFDLLVEAGLIADEGDAPGSRGRPREPALSLGRSLQPGHRRILAAGIGRLRADLKTRPLVFELMDDAFSLYELQRTVEAILGPNLHKQNFRRLIETAGLVEPTGKMRSHTGGRPAKLYRFRRHVLLERPASGLKIRT